MHRMGSVGATVILEAEFGNSPSHDLHAKAVLLRCFDLDKLPSS
jgi:hypothetical protein